jgi:hypothetical protein
MYKSLLNQMGRFIVWPLKIVWLLFMTAHFGYPEVRPDSVQTQELVRQVVENELQARAMDSMCWKYFSKIQESDNVRIEIVVEGRTWTLRRLIAQNGSMLNPKQLQQEDQRIRGLIHNPRDLEKQAHEDRADLQKIQSLFKMLPDALLYNVESADGTTIRLSFQPNPKFHSTTFESRIFRVLQGSMIVDAGQKRMIEFRGRLARDLDFGFGILGKLSEGGYLELRQGQIQSGQWVATSFNVQVTGRAWFFKTIGRQRQESRWAFQRFPESLTLEDAADLTKREVSKADP